MVGYARGTENGRNAMGKQEDWKKVLRADPTDWLLERAYKELADTQEKKVFYWYQNSLKLYITGKELAEIQEKKGQPSKWVTLRALRVLKQAGQ
jgi:hypothetical protein